MSGVDLALLIGVVLIVMGFTALVVVLVRVLDAMRLLRREIEAWRDEIEPLLDTLQSSTEGARIVMEEAREDLVRFDRVLGSAEAISDAMEGTGRVTRVALSAPVIKIAALASGTSRAAQRMRNGRPTERGRRRRAR
ncbi:MAG: hypothetical protein ACKOA6_06035 [Actinomycetota bacterium]